MSVKLNRLGVKKEKAHAKFDDAKKEMEEADAEYKAEENLEAGDAIREHNVTPDMLIRFLDLLDKGLPGNADLEELFKMDDVTDHGPGTKYETKDLIGLDDEDNEDDEEEEMI